MHTTIDRVLLSSRGDLVPGFFGPVHDWSEHAAGKLLMEDAILAGDDLAQTLLLCLMADEARGGQDQRAGAMDGLLACLDILQAAGKAFSVRSAFALAVDALAATGVRRRALVRSTPPNRGAEMLSLLLQAGRAAGPYLRRAEPAAPPAAPAPVQVSVALQLPDGPVPMAIVSQPATRSVQTVERDSADEIVRTVTETSTSG